MLSINDVLVARDFSDVSDRALRYALDLAARTGARLHVLYAEVLHDLSDQQDRLSPGEDVEAFRKQIAKGGEVSIEALQSVAVEDVVRRDVSPGPAILNYADEAGVDLIALGTHGRRGPGRMLLGSVAEDVVRRAQQPVLTVRGEEHENRVPRTPGAIDRILVPIDFSEYSREALLYAKEWAGLYGATIDVLHVITEDLHPAFYVGGVKSIYDVEPNIEQKATDKLDAFVAESDGPSIDTESHVAVGSPPAKITEFVAEQGVDLVSMSTHGRTGLDRFLLGSVAEKVVRYVHCPVLTVKAFGHSLASSEKEEHAESGG